MGNSKDISGYAMQHVLCICNGSRYWQQLKIMYFAIIIIHENSNNSLTRQSAVSGACLESYGTLQQVERMGGVLGNVAPA